MNKMNVKTLWQKNVKNSDPAPVAVYDKTLLGIFLALLAIGWVMVFSASVGVNPHNPYFYVIRNSGNILVALVAFGFTLCLPLKLWNDNLRYWLFWGTLLLLVMVFVTGHSAKGAARWIDLGIIRFQPAELAKLSVVLFVASYIERNIDIVRSNILNILRPMLIISGFLLFIYLERDTGTLVLLCGLIIVMLFLAGARISGLAILFAIAVVLVGLMITHGAHYRMARLANFWDPCASLDVFRGNGYQQCTSLMATSRGEFFGVGLGNSLQKLSKLPEVQTDYVMAIWGEEFGLLGWFVVLALFALLIWKAMRIGYNALQEQQNFSGFVALGIGIWFFGQMVINVGGVLALLPSKGFTLPFISYGGSSILVSAVALGLLMRIDYETRLIERGEN